MVLVSQIEWEWKGKGQSKHGPPAKTISKLSMAPVPPYAGVLEASREMEALWASTISASSG